jgi:hypothetical protein
MYRGDLGNGALAANDTFFGVAGAGTGGLAGEIVWTMLPNGRTGTLGGLPQNRSSSLSIKAFAASSCGFAFTPQQGLYLATVGSAFPVSIFTGASPTSVAVDNGVVYWADASGAIGALPLP